MNWQTYRDLWRWRLLYSPRGILAGLGIILGLGRLFGFGLTASLTFGPLLLFALALLTGGLALLVSLPFRLRIGGRFMAVYATFCFAFMAAGTWGNTASLLYIYCAALCIWEATTRRAYDC